MTHSWFLLLPAAFLALLALALLVLPRLRPGFGFTWLITTGGVMLMWGSVAALRIAIPLYAQYITWQPSSFFTQSPAFLLDGVSWPFSLALVSLMLAGMLTAVARGTQRASALAWAGSLAATAAGLAAVLAANAATLLLCWVLLDLIELIILVREVRGPATTQRAALAFAARTAGVFLVYWASLTADLSWEQGAAPAVPAAVSLVFLLGAGLRLGVLPLHLPYSQEPPLRRGIGTILRITPAIASLAALVRVPLQPLPDQWAGWITAFLALAAFYGALQFAAAETELHGRPFWIIALAALALANLVAGNQVGAVSWSLALCYAGGLVLLGSLRARSQLVIQFVGLWALSGLPYSLTASGWRGLVDPALPGFQALFLLSVAILLAGYARHILRAQRLGDPPEAMERWVSLIFPLGLVSLATPLALLGALGWAGSRVTGVPWASGLVLGGSLLVSIAAWRVGLNQQWRPSGPLYRAARPVVRSIYAVFSTALRLDWLYIFLWGAYQGLGRMVTGFTTILEGDGGVLWTLVLLALLITLLRAGGAG